MLPNESLLQVLHFANYRTLVFAKLAGRRFLRLVIKFATELARRRFLVYFFTTYIEYYDVTIGEGANIRYEHASQASLAAACRELAVVIGPHDIAILTFYGNLWNMPGIGIVFVAAPALKQAENVALHSPPGSTVLGNSDVFMSNFPVMKSLRLWLNNKAREEFRWSFLLLGFARKLQRIAAFTEPSSPSWAMNCFVQGFVRHYASLPLLLGGESLELDFSANRFVVAFVLGIIEQLKNSRCAIILRMSTEDGELNLDASEYASDVDGTTARYASKKNGLAVEANERGFDGRIYSGLPHCSPTH